MSLKRRLHSLESRVSPPRSSSGIRERFREFLDRVAAMRRGELGPEEAAEVEAMSRALQQKFAEIRGVR